MKRIGFASVNRLEKCARPLTLPRDFDPRSIRIVGTSPCHYPHEELMFARGINSPLHGKIILVKRARRYIHNLMAIIYR